ncbi:unannotated protein [freshwater metagenome]|uniref:Unannotated protein n=1 Tax=freshwater metagenome TaxID=449393 RepID=A0A6J7KAD1_9ZZZZ
MNPLPAWAELEVLRDQYGDGFWLLDPDTIATNVDAFRRAFTEAGWPRTDLAWSFKTLWAPPAVRAALDVGCRAEVVSRDEYELALRLGADPRSIIVNGPLTSYDDLKQATSVGAQVHLDSLAQVEDLLAVCVEIPEQQYSVGLRVNSDLALGPRGRFGIDADAPDGGDLRQAYLLLSAQPNVRVVGLHMHLAGARTAESFARRAARLIELSDALWGDLAPDFLDIGGGFAGAVPQSLAEQLGYQPPTPSEYAHAVVPLLLARWPEGGPLLIIEPGVALAADSMRFAARVMLTKSIGGVSHAIVAGSTQTAKPARHRFELPLSVVRADDAYRPPRHTVVSGWTCQEDDILALDLAEPVEADDWVVIDNCGAYTFVLASRFIRGIPALLVRGPDGWECGRRADTVDDWLEGFTAP